MNKQIGTLTERPERIAKMALYLQDKEPLIYLFIINADFYKIEEEILQTAGVGFENNRVKFYYSEEFINKLTPRQLLFLISHEAFHVLKKHHERHKNLKNKLMANVAEDAVINYEILESNYEYSLKPEKIPKGIYADKNYFFSNNEIETFRYYDWLLQNKTANSKSNLLREGSKIKIKSTGEYGIITKNNFDDTYKVKTGSLEDVLNEKTTGKEKTEHEDNLIPVVTSSQVQKIGGSGEEDFEIEIIDDNFDIHSKNKEENKEVQRELFSDKLVKQAERLEENIKHKAASNKGSGGLLDTIKKLNKPKINWKKKIRQKLNLFIATNAYEKEKRKSVINYPWDAKSQYGILGKYNIQLTKNLQSYIIFAIDTSGSVFYSDYDKESFFTEIDHAAKELEFNKKGEILTIQWDTEVVSGLKKYNTGDWKNYKFEGGGGTTPTCVFNYLDKIFEDKGTRFLINEKENEIKFYTQSKNKLPYLVFLTDGDFFSPIIEKNLGIYKKDQSSLLWFARHDKYIFPKENFVRYE